MLSQQLTAIKSQKDGFSNIFYVRPDNPVSTIYQTPTYKPMLCANSAFNKLNF